MKIEIGKPVKTTRHINKYKIYIEFMTGDADGYESLTLFVSKSHEKDILKLLEFLERCAKAYPYGRGSKDTYNHVEGWNYFCGHSPTSDYSQTCSFSWPIEIYGEFQCTYEKVIVTFFDKNGIEHETKII